MELRQERISILSEFRHTEHDSTKEAEEDHRRTPQHGVAAHSENGAAFARDDALPGSSAEDWTGTLDLVLRAGERLVESDARVRDLEVELRELTQSASDEIERLRAQLVDLQGQLASAEAGRRHAEDWLRRLTDAVREHFSPEAIQASKKLASQAS